MISSLSFSCFFLGVLACLAVCSWWRARFFLFVMTTIFVCVCAYAERKRTKACITSAMTSWSNVRKKRERNANPPLQQDMYARSKKKNQQIKKNKDFFMFLIKILIFLWGFCVLFLGVLTPPSFFSQITTTATTITMLFTFACEYGTCITTLQCLTTKTCRSINRQLYALISAEYRTWTTLPPPHTRFILAKSYPRCRRYSDLSRTFGCFTRVFEM